MNIVVQYTLQQGQPPPPSLSIKYEDSASHGGQSPVNESVDEGQVWLNLKSIIADLHGQLCQKDETSFQQKKDRPHEGQESGFVLKHILSDLTRLQGQRNA